MCPALGGGASPGIANVMVGFIIGVAVGLFLAALTTPRVAAGRLRLPAPRVHIQDLDEDADLAGIARQQSL